MCVRYAKAGRAADAVAVRRDRFRVERSPAAYRQLRSAARTADCWEAERAAALATLREDARRERGGRQWERLADLARETHPGEALDVYARPVERSRRPTGDRAHERLARLLLGVRDCRRALGAEDAFTVYLTGLRTELKRRRKLMSVLERYGL
ncbi:MULTISPECIES: hypothetical protein [unclassified Streptomyces]|uniref:hypothetical protein n=1 Tax=unclassified Streptomyces TaxID=2593676 RepID=UPI0036F77042